MRRAPMLGGEKTVPQFGLEAEYAVKPGHWGDMRSYKSVKYQGLNFSSGDFAYFAKTIVAPEEVSEEETLASPDPLRHEREHNYIGMIAEARADSAQDVRLRILYAYWPEELPEGRKPYHGMKEVILSNHMDIMDAHTITGKVEVQQLEDSADSVDGLYWRQTLDITKFEGTRKKGQAPGVLSKLKGHCRCGQPWNPDKTIYVCQKCRTWNHEECLLDAVLEEAWSRRESGTLGEDEGDDEHLKEGEETIEVAPQETETKTSRSPVSGLVNAVSGLKNAMFGSASPAPHATADTAGGSNIGSGTVAVDASQLDVPAGAKGSREVKKDTTKVRMPGDAAPWDGLYSATIDTTGRFGKEEVTMAQVVDESTGEAVLTIAAACFKCGKKLD